MAPGSSKEIVKKESRGQGAVLKEPYTEESRTISVHPGQAFLGDNRSSSGLGLGDGLVTHTSKWLQVRASSAAAWRRRCVWCCGPLPAWLQGSQAPVADCWDYQRYRCTPPQVAAGTIFSARPCCRRRAKGGPLTRWL